LKLIVEDRQNPREDYTNVPDLAVAMFGMGQLTPCEVRVSETGDKAVLTAGHRRFRAAKYINEHYDQWIKEGNTGSRFEGLLCRAEPIGLDDSTRLIRQLNQGDHDVSIPLNPIERAKAYKKLMDGGMNYAEIGRHMNKSAQQIANTLSLINAPKELQEAVERGESSATAVQRAVKASPEKRQDAVEKAKKHEKIKVKDSAEYVPLTPKQFTSTIRKADGILQAATGKEEKARWEGVVRGLRIGSGFDTIDF
jgi:ParB-like chromosome segregation protein Spo0J